MTHVKLFRAAPLALALALLAVAGCSDAPAGPASPPRSAVSAAPGGGAFAAPVAVVLRCEDHGAGCVEIRYTLDGAEPTRSSPRYVAGEAIAIPATSTLRFAAWDAQGRVASGSERYVVDGAPPAVAAVPPGGLFADAQVVTLVCSDAPGTGCGAIHYTLDGSAPSASSPVYGPPLLVGADATLRFYAEDALGNRSADGAERYRIDTQAPATTAAPAGGTFGRGLLVTLGCTDGGGAGCAATHYTLDGTAPTLLSPAAEGPLAVDASATLRAFSVDGAGNAGAEAVERYVVDVTPPTTAASPAAGIYRPPLEVTLTCEDAAGCAETWSTTDGAVPGMGTPGASLSRRLQLPASATVRFSSVDAAGNVEAPREVRYELDGSPPVTTPAPPGGTFAAPVDVALACDDGSGPAAAGCDAIRYTLDGSAPGPASARYAGPIHLGASATLRFAAMDLVGNAEAPRSERYVVDTTPPAIASSVPADGEGGVAPDASVAIVLDEEIAAGTLAVTAETPSGAVAGTSGYDPATRTVTFTPAAALPADAAVTVRLAAGLADRLGNATAAPLAVAFRTLGLPAVVSGGAGEATVRNAALATTPAGDSLSIFTAATGTATPLLYATRAAGAATWSAPAVLSRAGGTNVAVLADAGGFLVAYATLGASGYATVVRTLRGGVLGPEVALATASVGGLVLASNGTGYAAAWQTTWYTGSTYLSVVQARVQEGGAWLPPTTFGTATESADAPALASAGGGYALAFRIAATTPVNVARRIQAFVYQGGGAWTGQDAFIDATRAVSAPALASDGARYGLVVATVRDVQAAIAPAPPAGGTLALAFAPLEARSGVALVALGAGSGGFAAAWQGVEATEAVTRVAVLDASGWSPPAEVWRATGKPSSVRVLSSAARHLALARVKDAAGAIDTRLAPLAAGGSGPATPPFGAGAQGVVVAASPGGFLLSAEEDDGAAIQLRSRAHDGVEGGAVEDVLAAPLPASATRVRLAANAAGDVLAVFQAPHRGETAVYAALGRGGAFAPPELVAFPAAGADVASDGSGFMVGWMRPTDSAGGGEVMVRRRDASGFAAAEQVTSGARAFSVVLGSDGATWAVVYDEGTVGGVQVRIGDGAAWTPSFQLTPYGSVSSYESILARPGGYDVGFSDFTVGAGLGRLRRGKDGWELAVVRLGDASTGSAWDGPALAGANEALAALWYTGSRAYASFDAGAGFTAPVALTSAYCADLHDSFRVAVSGGEFLVAAGCRDLKVFSRRDGAWAPLEAPSRSDVTGIALAAGGGGFTALYVLRPYYGPVRMETVHVRGGVVTLGSSLPVAPVGALQLVHDGEAFTGAWSEIDPLDDLRAQVVVRRGL